MADRMGKRIERTGEKSNFSLTCSRLSQFLKEKGSFGDLGLEIAPRPLEQDRGIIRAPTAMKLMPGVDLSEQDRSENGADQTAAKSMDLFPQHAGFDSVVAPAKVESSMSSHNKEPEKNQLTIFYGGKVLAFDNFPAEKVKDLMQMAMKGSLAAQNLGFATPSSTTAARVDFSHQNSSNIASTPASQPVVLQNSMPKPAQANASADMPIARKNSLHRFLEKRKDRISTKAPYQVNAAAASSAAVDAAKEDDSKSWLGLGRPVSKPERSDSEGKR